MHVIPLFKFTLGFPDSAGHTRTQMIRLQLITNSSCSLLLLGFVLLVPILFLHLTNSYFKTQAMGDFWDGCPALPTLSELRAWHSEQSDPHVSDLASGTYFGLFPSLRFQSHHESFKNRKHSSSLFSRVQISLSVNTDSSYYVLAAVLNSIDAVAKGKKLRD